MTVQQSAHSRALGTRMFKLELSLHRARVIAGSIASLVLAACSHMPVETVEPCAPLAVTTRTADDVQRIDKLQRESSDFKIQVHDLWRQISVRRRQFLEERKLLEQELKEVRERAGDLQKKLDAVLAVDRDLRRGGKITQ